MSTTKGKGINMIDKIGNWVSFICACMIFSLTVASVVMFGFHVLVPYVASILVLIYGIKLWKGF